ncbi:Autotransporter-associated beta strand repeat [uncultured Caudovirales phage]|uniref:Autotransporter-associated beta strand repeat n=1 Tax=uncultured Caudovirales phage TaxID=2100421 RepID=A0A6J5M3L0_9CAUD|nr:Autotransporter-associated beta strand repeat [uncultured Caudovirales phage]CAB4218144.1 Autotransporter-associated beta strand repeat [uncultured Caudovirales phage]
MPLICQPAKSAQAFNIAKYPLVTSGYGAENYVVNSGIFNTSLYLVGSQTIILSPGKSIGLSGLISGPGNLLLPGLGTVTILTPPSYTGSTHINGSLVINLNTATTFSSAIFGSGSVSANGVGNVTFSLPNSYSGTTTVTNGTLSTSINGALSTNTITNNSIVWFNPLPSSTSSLTYSNNFVLNNGLVRCGYSSSPNSAGSVTLNGTVTLNGVNCEMASVYNANIIVNGKVTGSGRFVVQTIPGGPGGSNTFQGARIFLENTSNDYTGGTFINSSNIGFVGNNANGNFLFTKKLGSGPIQIGNGFFGDSGVLVLEADNAINPSSVITLLFNSSAYAAELRLNGFSTQCGGIVNNGKISSNATSILTLNTNSALTFNGSISSAISLVMQGSSTQTLAGTNSYSGSTTVLSGVLNFPNAVPASTQWVINVNNTGPTSTGGLMTLVASPNFSGKTINILCSGASTGLNLVVVSWSGTATNSPNLQLNGSPVISGVPSGGITITYNASGTITITS